MCGTRGERGADIPDCDAIVIGSGPNLLVAAIRLAQSGMRMSVVEANATIGGGARSAELTLPGFVHDVCSAVYPLVFVRQHGSTAHLRLGPSYVLLPLRQAAASTGCAAITLLKPRCGGFSGAND